MRNAIRFIVPALFVFFLSCASTPILKPNSEEECLVLIKTEVENPSSVPLARSYFFQLSSGGGDRPFSPNSSFMMVVVKEPASRISSYSTRISMGGYTGSSETVPMNVLLPYYPGYVVIADFAIVLTIEEIKGVGARSWISMRDTTTWEKEQIYETASKSQNFAKWKYRQP